MNRHIFQRSCFLLLFLWSCLITVSLGQGQDCAGTLKGEKRISRNPDRWVPVPDYRASADDIENRSLLLSNGIVVNKCACPSGISFKTFRFLGSTSPGCTTVGGLQNYTLSGLILLKESFGETVVVTGGTEQGHSAIAGHSSGDKIDLRIASGPYAGFPGDFDDLSKFIVRGLGGHFRNIGARSDGALLYGPAGVIFALETFMTADYSVEQGAHWDIKFTPQYSNELTIEKEGDGSGQVSQNPSGPPCTASSFECRILLSGTIVDLTSSPDPGSIFAGWTDVDSSNDLLATIELDQDASVTAEFDSRGDPPDGSGCWSPTATGWMWNCPGPPPLNGGNPQSPNGHCWQWNAQALSWVAIQCGGGCVKSNGKPSALNFGTCNPTGTYVEIIVSGDPNDKAGSQGVGQSQYIAGATALRYAIAFGNEKTASAPACRVSITDPLDAVNEDLITFGLGPIGFLDRVVTPPPAATSFSTTVDLRPAQDLLVSVDGHLDGGTSSASWTLQCLDPTTHLPPADTSLGFLPPGGNGSVFFTVMAKNTAVTGTKIPNQATIVFDKNAPIPTPTWTNTLDRTPPKSRVSPLPSTETTSCFVVPWTGSDFGSGLAGFTLYASDNGGPYSASVSNTKSPTGVFNGQPGHSYSFYVQATDLVGNVEPAKTSAETTTTVMAGASCNGRPTLSGSIASKSITGTTETITLQLTNNGIGNAPSSSLNQLIFRTLAGSGTVKLINPAGPIQLGSLAAGASTTVTLTLEIPSTVKDFSVIEQGTLQDVKGDRYAFSIGQTIFP